MNIWYIHPYGGGPGIGLYDRPYQLARAWQRQGHSVTIFIARFHHLLEKQVALDEEFLVDNIQYITVPTRHYFENNLRRFGNIWDFATNFSSVVRRVASSTRRPDAIIVSSPHPFAVFAAWSLAKRLHAKLIFEIRDIWPLSITEIVGASRLHPFVILCSFTERFALQRSDLIASVLPQANVYLRDRGYYNKSFVWTPNGIDAHALEKHVLSDDASRRACAKLREWRSQGRVTVIYTGSIGVPNAVELLTKALHYANSIGEGDKCGVVIVGKGNQLGTLRQFATDNELSNVHFTGLVPKADAAALLYEADIGYAGLRDIPALFSYGVSPNKIADYFRASLPAVLPITPCGDPVSESGGGIARRAQTPAEVWGLLRTLIYMSSDERRALGRKGKAYMEREYDYDIVARRYVEAIARA